MITVESNLEKKGEQLTEEVNKAHEGLANFKHASYREIHSIKGESFDKISDTNQEIEAFRKIYDQHYREMRAKFINFEFSTSTV